MVAVQIVTTSDYKGPKTLVLDRVPILHEAVNCYGGFLFVTHVVHLPKDDANPPSAVIKCNFNYVER